MDARSHLHLASPERNGTACEDVNNPSPTHGDLLETTNAVDAIILLYLHLPIIPGVAPCTMDAVVRLLQAIIARYGSSACYNYLEERWLVEHFSISPQLPL
jgi:hypothetical protein